MINLHKEVRKELFETQLAEKLNHPEDFARLFMKKRVYSCTSRRGGSYNSMPSS
jgi:hypothetical protein